MRPHRNGRHRSFDGTELDYRVYGNDGPWLVIVNGLGSTYDTWEPLVEAVGPRWRVLIWDYRGLYASEVPRNRRHLDVIAHCRDLEHLMDALDIREAVLAAWSMGVQISLEAVRAFPERVRGIVLVNGTYGRFFSACLRVPGIGRLLLPALRVGRLAAPLVGMVVSRVVLSPDFVARGHRLGLLSTDSPRIGRAAAQFARIDWDVYLQIAASMESHDASSVLPEVQVPTILIAGDRDPMAPPWVIRRMARALPRVELVPVPGGTHYTLLEHTERVVAAATDFLERQFPEAS